MIEVTWYPPRLSIVTKGLWKVEMLHDGSVCLSVDVSQEEANKIGERLMSGCRRLFPVDE